MDIILPYVDASDRLWSMDFMNTTKQSVPSPIRFRSWGTLKYLMRAIDTNLKFVDSITLIVSRGSQVPNWINPETVKVIYHQDFIPDRYLPVFNSCTIESYLFNIPNLPSQFLYFNDDLFPINPLTIEDFFTECRPHIRFIQLDHCDNSIYHRQCRASLDLITDALGIDRYPTDKLLIPEHSITPMLKSTLLSVKALCESKIGSTISTLREDTNINQYIYSYYQYFTGNYIPKLCSFVYLELSDDLSSIGSTILNSPIKVMCLNDSIAINDYSQTSDALIRILDFKFPDKSKFEG